MGSFWARTSLNYQSDTINYLKENNPNAQKSVLELMDTFELYIETRNQLDLAIPGERTVI